ncbi:MAG: hypothetical protein ACOZF0_00160 [Thermodesulfobacteriota bacterium]
MSNDFLKNIRSGKDKQPQSRTNYDRHQYHYESQQQYFGNEKRNGQDRRRVKMTPFEETLVELVKTMMPAVTTFLENAVQCQKRAVELEELKAKAESEKTEIMKTVFEYVKSSGLEGALLARDTRKKRTRARKPLDQNRKKILQVIEKMRNKGETFDNIALYLEKEQFQTFSGRGQWHAQTVHRLFQDYLVEE